MMLKVIRHTKFIECNSAYQNCQSSSRKIVTCICAFKDCKLSISVVHKEGETHQLKKWIQEFKITYATTKSGNKFIILNAKLFFIKISY